MSADLYEDNNIAAGGSAITTMAAHDLYDSVSSPLDMQRRLLAKTKTDKVN